MTDTYTPQAVNQARNAFKRKVKKAGATFFYGAMCGFFTAEELDDILFEASEVAKFLLEVEGTRLDIDEEISIEDRITHVMRNVAESAAKVLKAREAGEDQGPGRVRIRLGSGGGSAPWGCDGSESGWGFGPGPGGGSGPGPGEGSGLWHEGRYGSGIGAESGSGQPWSGLRGGGNGSGPGV